MTHQKFDNLPVMTAYELGRNIIFPRNIAAYKQSGSKLGSSGGALKQEM